MAKSDQFTLPPAAAPATRRRSRAERLAEATGDTPAGPPPDKMRVTRLVPYPRNPRKTFNKQNDLANSLSEQNQKAPLLVVTKAAYLAACPDDAEKIAKAEEDNGEEAYGVVIDGNRRWKAFRTAGIEEARITVNDSLASSAADLLETALITGLQSEKLNPIEEAEALRDLVKEHGSQRAVARRLSVSNTHVIDRIRLLNLSEDLQEKLIKGELQTKDAAIAARAAEDEQEQAVDRARAEREARNASRRTPQSNGAEAGDSLGQAGAQSPGGSAATTPEETPEPKANADTRSTPPAPPENGPSSGSAATTPEPSAGEKDRDSSPQSNGAEAGDSLGQAGAQSPGGSAATTPGPDNIERWDDLPHVAEVIRGQMPADARRQLAAMITD